MEVLPSDPAPPSLEQPPAFDLEEDLLEEDLQKEEASRGFLSSAGDRLSSVASSVADVAQKAADVGLGAAQKAAAEQIAPDTDVPQGLNFPGFKPKDERWSWRDLPRAFVGIFDLHRVLFTTAGFWAALVIFALLESLGAFLGSKVGILESIISVISWFTLLSLSAFVASVMGYVLHQSVIEQRHSSVKEGMAWTMVWLKSVVGTPLAFVGVIVALAAVEGLLGFLGRVIPFAGPIIWGVFSPFLVVASLVAGAIALALLYSLPLYIPVIYNEETGPRETLMRLFLLFRRRGSHLVGYMLVSLLMIGFAFIVTLLPAWLAGRMLTGKIAALSMGPDFMATLMKMPSAFTSFGGLVYGVEGASFPEELGLGHTLGGIFAAFGAAAGIATLLALMALTYYTSGCIIYSIITKRKKIKPAEAHSSTRLDQVEPSS